MAVPIEAYSVVVRDATLAAKYPGGVSAYRNACPNNTYSSDSHISRVGFMNSRDADHFIAELAAAGLTPFRDGAAEDVALVTQHAGLARPCDWLEFALYQGSLIAWLAGTEPGNIHAPHGWEPGRVSRHMTAEEAKERLEFLRTENGIDIYRDKQTGEEVYVGRTGPNADHSRHDQLYQQASNLAYDLILLDDREPVPLDDAARQRLADAVKLFEEVIALNPSNWAAMWMLGKVFQRLEDPARGLEWFARAHRVNPDQPDVAREASIAAMDAGRPADAVGYCERALQVEPDNAGLRANLALALLFCERVPEAQAMAQDALARAPDDAITQNLARTIDEVAAGRLACPHHVRDLGPGSES
jgi:tetratricopeptide (TPR) repeat protein